MRDDGEQGEPTVPRRSMLRHAGVAAGVAAVATVGVATQARSGTEPPAQLTGSWMIDRQDDGTPSPVRGVFSFTAGDVVIYHNIAPADGGAVVTGTWASAGDGTFRSTFWTGFDADPVAGTPSVTARVRANLNVDGDTMSGTYDTAFFDATTSAELFALNGSLTGARIQA